MAQVLKYRRGFMFVCFSVFVVTLIVLVFAVLGLLNIIAIPTAVIILLFFFLFSLLICCFGAWALLYAEFHNLKEERKHAKTT